MTRKGVIVVDIKGSPLWRAAVSHTQGNVVEILAAIDFPTNRSLVRAIVKSQPDFVIFSWRGALDAIFQSKYSRKKLIALDPWIFLLIPDFLGVKHFYKKEQDRIDMCDGILVTSHALLHEYKKLYRVDEIQLLHDLPDLELIGKVKARNLTREKNRVIWVGNSKWGKRAGYVDHKGLTRFVLPLEKILGPRLEGVEFRIIDSAIRKHSHLLVLEEIAQSECLIITSDSEGTGLPILEAAALGTPVVCFDVGIASELFISSLSKQIVPRELNLLVNTIESTLENLDQISLASQARFREYYFEVANDLERIKFPLRKYGKWRTQGSRYEFADSLKWCYRWLRR